MTAAAHAHVNHEVLNSRRALGQLELPAAGAHDARRPPTQGQVGESWRHRIPDQASARAPAPVPTQPNRQPGWLLASLGVLASALVLVGGLAVLAARRARRRAPPPTPSLTR
jgi:hypothetical protein